MINLHAITLTDSKGKLWATIGGPTPREPTFVISITPKIIRSDDLEVRSLRTTKVTVVLGKLPRWR